MGLLDLPAELRVQIFQYLPDLSYDRHETIGPNVRLTPPICRTSHTLRQEALPMYAKTSFFIIQSDDNDRRVNIWLDMLGDEALCKVENLQLSRHWKLAQPSRWQGHVGFYVRLQLLERKSWQLTAGTYPIANDIRGMRAESVDLLRSIISQRLGTRSQSRLDGDVGLTRSDVGFITGAMDIVASHPISTFDIEQSEAGRQRRRGVWSVMERKLLDLQAAAASEAEPSAICRSAFYTPY